MSKAIKIKLEKAAGEYDYGRSKFFGDPTIPAEWEDRFEEDVLFFAQLRLEELAPYDKENRLPHKGYLYLFLDTAQYPPDVWVDYYDGEPDTLVEDFNALDPENAHLTQAYLMSFEECDESESCTRLFGLPSSEFEDEDGEPLLLQFDPLDTPIGFLEQIDGYAYVFYDTARKDLNGATYLQVDQS